MATCMAFIKLSSGFMYGRWGTANAEIKDTSAENPEL